LKNYNPFQNLDLTVPDAYREDINRYSQTQTDALTRISIEHAPFPRYVDAWYLAFCLGARSGKPEKVVKPHRFVHAEIIRESHRIDQIELVAIAWSGDPWIINRPSEVISLANEFAASGLRDLMQILTEGTGTALWNLTDHLSEVLATTSSTP
jgi:hypothetical protein